MLVCAIIPFLVGMGWVANTVQVMAPQGQYAIAIEDYGILIVK
jgi:hypothetical protein